MKNVSALQSVLGICLSAVRHSKTQNSVRQCQLVTKFGEFNYSLKRSRARRTLEISVLDSAEVRVAAPFHFSENRIHAFIHQKAEWIVRKVRQAEDQRRLSHPMSYVHREEFLFLGRRYPLMIEAEGPGAKGLSFNGRHWLAKITPDQNTMDRPTTIKEMLVSWYREQAKEIFGGRVYARAREMGLEPLTIRIKSQRRIWGSCNVRNKSINLNWRLVLAPLEVIDYVVVHELSHLVWPNHSSRFWQKVAEAFPEYKKCQRWIKENRLELTLP